MAVSPKLNSLSLIYIRCLKKDWVLYTLISSKHHRSKLRFLLNYEKVWRRESERNRLSFKHFVSGYFLVLYTFSNARYYNKFLQMHLFIKNVMQPLKITWQQYIHNRESQQGAADVIDTRCHELKNWSHPADAVKIIEGKENQKHTIQL
jgi:hypothetical protein